MGKEPGQNKLMLWVAADPENLMAIVEEEGFVDANLIVLMFFIEYFSGPLSKWCFPATPEKGVAGACFY